MSHLVVYNSLTGQKEKFEPISPGYVGMYVCGPTVSGESHLGHARPYITFDVVYRYLRFLGNKVRYVRNITDAGHFEEEGREAEDKISKKAVVERLEPMELVHKYTNLFRLGMQQLNNLTPDIEPTATGHIVEQIEMIKKIIADGYAYEVNGSVYFDVLKYNADFSAQGQPYGVLSGRVLDDMIANTRDLDNQDEKRNSADFALWKKAPPQHIMRWASPWGEGFPGWHIECSAMSTKYLGKRFDLHGGGMDLLFPHHEGEIAQSTVCNHQPPVKYWMHNNMITINGRKMGKSYNNFITLTELFNGNNPVLQQAYHPMTVRFFILQTHYRSTLDFSNEALIAADKGLKRLWEAYENLQSLQNENDFAGDDELDNKVRMLVSQFTDFINDDFNTAKVLANMFELASIINGLKAGHIHASALSRATLVTLKQQMKTFLEDILGIQLKKEADHSKLNGVIELLIDIRKAAKDKKDYATSDRIRNELLALGIQLKDEKDGTVNYSLN